MGCCGGGGFFRRQPTAVIGAGADGQNSPIDSLKTRLARGEITVEEYQKLLSVLQEDQMVRR
jgi:uncharacterized membrane protein